MNDIDLRQLESLFHGALALTGKQREEYLAQACAGDPVLRREVESLLAADARAEARFRHLDQAMESALGPLRPGDTIGRYRIDELIAEGGMGLVYRARDLQLQRRVALKILHLHRATDERAKTRFLSEARAASRLDHANICTIYEVGEHDDGKLYIAMAFCPGESLDRRLQRNRPDPDTALVIAIQLADALRQAHAQGIVHRDLKPGNVIIDDRQRIKLVDFGIAKITGENLSQTGEALGTLAYMAPEQFGGQGTDHRCDIWALGVMLYEMLFGQRPFRADSSAALMHAICRQPPPLPAGLPPALEQLLEACLQKQPWQRLESAEAVLMALRELRGQPLGALPQPTVGGDGPQPAIGNTTASERRSLTVLRYTLHAADEQMQEDMLPRLPELQARIGRIARGFNGRSDRIGGDEGTLYFGYPQADEHAAHNAVRCALALRAGQGSDALSGIRIGIHSGTMVVDETHSGSAEPRMIGEAPRIAEAIRNQCAAGAILISDACQRRVAGYFECEKIETAEVGDGSTLPLWRIKGESAARTRLESQDSERLSPWIGRVHELGLLQQAWEQARSGDGRTLAVFGEPGIGKSRLVYEFTRPLLSEAGASVGQCVCTPYWRNSELRAVVEALRRGALALDTDATPEQKLARLDARLASLGLAPQETLPLLAELLGLESPGKTAEPTLSAESRRRKTHELLLRLLLEPANQGPLLLIFEDLHWADPSSLELLDQLIADQPPGPVMILCTYRPEFTPTWSARAQVTSLNLGKLQAADSAALLASLGERRPLSTSLVSQLLARADGNPLFIEELGRAMLERMPPPGAGDDGSAQIPLTLGDSLLARLDRLDEAKPLAQHAAVIGREFNRELLARVLGEENGVLEERLRSLQAADLIHRIGPPGSAEYRFRHALIRDAAYDSLLRHDRRRIHQSIARELQRAGAGDTAAPPELLAFHFDRGGQADQASVHWLKAGQRALQRHAIDESISHCRAGLRAVAELPESADGWQLELHLCMTLGPALMAAKGYADPEVDTAYSRARELCARLGDTLQLFPVLFGLWTFHCVRARHPAALALAEQLVEMSRGDAGLMVEAHMVRGISCYFRGDFRAARADFAKAWEAYDPDMAATHIPRYGQDPGMVILSYQSWNEWMLGAVEAADTASEQALAHSRGLRHPFSLAYALTFAAWHALNRGRPERAESLLAEAISLCQEQSLQVFHALALALDALRMLAQGQGETGMAAMQRAFAAYTATGAELFLPSWFGLSAQVHLGRGDTEAADEAISRAMTLMEQSEENWCLAEIHRTRGLIAQVRGDPAGARACFDQALATAEAQAASAWRERIQTATQASG